MNMKNYKENPDDPRTGGGDPPTPPPNPTA